MASIIRKLAFCVLGAALAAACGDNIVPAAEIDAAVSQAICGNGTVETGEDCDDGDVMGDNLCDTMCHFTCGNGVVDATAGELCDTGIASGTGACPTVCNDGMACTQDVLNGTACQAECFTAPITTPMNGDGCCPAGANTGNDNDCVAGCGNGVVDTGELCDTGIATGTGSCPTTCNDGQSCTLDALSMGGTCRAACTTTPITLPANGDGCCPAGANTGNDNDCVAGCGNGVVDSGETCDTAITTGAGRCPATCTDGVACTRDVLSNGGTCTAACSFPAITTPANGDGCCPAGGNNNNDNDCAPMCGNTIVEQGEQCDDGNTNNTDACNNNCQLTVVTGTAFRMNDMDLRDPHVFVNFIGCRDVTDTQLVGFSVNNELQTSIQTDGDNPPDNLLDLSIVAVFRPLNQGLATNALEIHFPACTPPLATTTCSNMPATSATLTATATNMAAGTCLQAIAGTTHGYTPGITNATGPCYVSNSITVTVNIAGIPITLNNARIAATYVGNPASNTVNGLLMGFISETDANNTTLPASLPLVGGHPLSELLPGGDPPGANNTNCASYSDIDMNGTTRGWWFYLNFTAPRVTWVQN